MSNKQNPRPIALSAPICSDLAIKHAANVDKLVGDAVTARLGHRNWEPFILAHRMQRARINDSPSETWMLDGKPLIEIWPPEIKQVHEGASIKMVATCQYRTFDQNTKRSGDTNG